MVHLGNLCARRGKIEDAEQWYLKAAETGGSSAMTNLGVPALTNRDSRSRRRRES